MGSARDGRPLGRAGVAVGLRELGEAEIQNLCETVGRHHDVLRLQIPVHDVGGVSLGEAVGHLGGDRQRLARRGHPFGEDLPQCLSRDELHGDPGDPVGLPDVVDRDDVRVVERGSGPGLLLEALQPLRVGGQGGRQHLDRDLAPEPRVPRLVHLSHSPGTQGRLDLVRTESRSG